MPFAFIREPADPDAEPLRLPYLPVAGGGDGEHGFMDLRGRPEAVDLIPEAARSLALADLLRALAQPKSRLATAGCNVTQTDILGAPTVIGLLRIYTLGRADTAWIDPLAFEVERQLMDAAGEDDWTLSWLPGKIDARALGEAHASPAPLLQFWATASGWPRAHASFERLTGTLNVILTHFARG